MIRHVVNFKECTMSPHIKLVTELFETTEQYYNSNSVIDNCQHIINVLIREPFLYTLSEKTLADHRFVNGFTNVVQMNRWLNNVSEIIFSGKTIGDITLLDSLLFNHTTLDSFNTDDKGNRVNVYNCLVMLKVSIEQVYIAISAYRHHGGYYERQINARMQHVFLYLETYIKEIENE